MPRVQDKTTPDGVDAILHFTDKSAKSAAFDYYWSKLDEDASRQIDVDALRLCVRLLPPVVPDESVPLHYKKLQDLLLQRISKVSGDEMIYYSLAEICLSNTQFGHGLFNAITNYIAAAKGYFSSAGGSEVIDNASTEQEHLQTVLAYLRLLKCSYWLPATQNQYATPELLNLLVGCIGLDGLDEDIHNTLSSLFTLLTNSPVVLKGQVVVDILFFRLRELPSSYFSLSAGKVYRTWFQWIIHAVTNGIHTEAVHWPFYWSKLQVGLLAGFADQRKYCLGILRQSLILLRHNINIPQMAMQIELRSQYILQYDKYCTLFETIVLDRYPNQVQACLPDLMVSLGSTSLISASWTTTLLSAALNPKVQDGIRKLIGNWYLDYIKQQGSITTHISFFVEGFLPWATQGNLHTSSLISTRYATFCKHGEALANAVVTFVRSMPTDLERRQVLTKVLGFILDTGGKMFSPSALYLLEGLLQGLRTHPITLGTSDVDLVLRISRLPNLPEIGTDLCIALCAELSSYIDSQFLPQQDLLSHGVLRGRFEELKHDRLSMSQNTHGRLPSESGVEKLSLQSFLERLNLSRHKIIQDGAFGPASSELIAFLDESISEPLDPNELLQVLDALWEEANRQEHPRPVVLKIPPLFFHPVSVRVCEETHSGGSDFNIETMALLLNRVLLQLQHFTEGRSYLLPALATSLRKACLSYPQTISVLPIDDFFVRFINNPPTPKKEFLFEVVAAQKLQHYLPHRDYATYYGQREWHGYAAVIDLLNRFPESQLSVAKQVMDRLLEPWMIQQAPIPIISKWKNVLQLQAMLLLVEACVSDENVDRYLEAFMHALVLEQWPRYRFLLEWIIARIYYQYPTRTNRILTDLSNLDESSPIHIASLMKLAILATPFLDSEDFALKLMIQLVSFSASPKVHIRHEAHWSFPILFDLANTRRWESITGNPAFLALDTHIRSLDRFSAPPSTIRTLKLDAVRDYTIAYIFQGQYLTIETPEIERVAYEDFLALYQDDSVQTLQLPIPPARIPLGDPIPDTQIVVPIHDASKTAPKLDQNTEVSQTFFQTKSGFDIASLLPNPGPPSVQQKLPASVILIASLIDNPTNLGGLSRISESFGLEALYIDDLKKLAHKDFKATSVTSEKHLPIRELKIFSVPDFLISMKRKGYEIVGIEQTDRSGILGEETGGDGVGTLPKKCVLVLGSERGGITSEVLAVVDRCVEIKTVGVTRSLNVQTAGGIAVYEWWREWGGKE